MANEEETMVIDSEFALFGPIGFDIGLLMVGVFAFMYIYIYIYMYVYI
jgi:5-methylthioribose kinase